jgi:secreted trypsin-like serine protease
MGDDEEIGSREIYNGTISRKELGRIVGGSKARKGQYPWFARGIDQWGDYHGCGGVLIASDFILTASHCAIGFDTEAPYAFEVGSLCYNKNGNCGQKQEFRKVARVIPHPKYDGLGVEQSYDFALMKLEEPCTITPAKIDINNFDLSTNYSPGRRLWVVGYGKKGFQDSLVNLPKRLQHVQVVSFGK